MASSTAALAGHLSQSIAQGWRVFFALLFMVGALSGCATPSVDTQTVSNLPPLRLDGTTLTAADAAGRVPSAGLLTLDEPMREFVARFTAGENNSRVRLMSLHQAVRGAGGLDMQYNPFADGNAREVFHRGDANCLSYANLFIALAREAGLEAHYQSVETRPQWSKVSDRVQVGLHVNVAVRLKGGKRYMVDIDPLPSRDISGSRELTDSEGEALYYNNIAMAALGNDDMETSWSYLIRALQLSPSDAHLWANLGALYRFAGQHTEAEQSYLQALELDFTEYSAMTNLAVLYGLEGREQEQNYWLAQVESHRRANPYYHAWQGDEAAAVGDWAAALGHYDRAVSLAPTDSYLLFSRGVTYYRLNDYDAAALNIEQAIKLATLHSDIVYFERQLEEVRKAQLADV